MNPVDPYLNSFFFVFHTGLLLFNLLGWLPRATRRWNLITLGATALSWFGLGIWFGWGYCVCTHWHWEVRRRLGIQEDYETYVQFLLDKLTGIKTSAELAFWATGAGFAVSVVMSLALNLRDRRRRRRAP